MAQICVCQFHFDKAAVLGLIEPLYVLWQQLSSVFGQNTRIYRVSSICGISPLCNSSSLYLHLYLCLCLYLYLCLHICISICVCIFVSVFMSVFVFVSSIAYLRLSASSLIPLWCAHSETDNARPRPGVHCPYKVWAVFSLFVFVYILAFFVLVFAFIFTIQVLTWHR